MRKILLLLVLLLLVTSVYAFSLPSIKPKLPSFEIPTQSAPFKAYPPTIPTPPPMNIKICEEGKNQCANNNFQVCDKNSWKEKQTCKFDEFCHEKNGCVKKQLNQPQLEVLKPVPEFKPVEGVPHIAQVCREGDVKCSSQRTNSVMICQDNQWVVQQKCAVNEECITGQGCVSKVTDAKFPDYSNYKPSIPTPPNSPVDLGCEKPGERTCMGSFSLTCKETQLGLIWTRSKDCGKPEFCDNKKGCLLTQAPYVDIAIKKPEIILDECSTGDKKCSEDKKEVIACSGGKWAREQICGENYLCKNNRCVPKTEGRTISKQELDKVIKDVEAQQDNLRDEQELASTAFQNFDQKINQLYNTLAAVQKEITNLRTGSKSSYLTSQEVTSEEISRVEKESEDLKKKLLLLIKESQQDMNEDKEYYLERLEEYNTMGEELSDYLNEQVDHSNELSQASAQEEITEEQRETNRIIRELLHQIQQGNVDAVSQLLILISKQSKDKQKEIAKELVSALNDLERKQEQLAKQLESLNNDKSQAGKLANLNKEMNSVSASRKAIINILRDTMQVQEEAADMTKSILDSQGRTARQVARFEVKKEEPTIIAKIANFFGKMFIIKEKPKAEPKLEQELTTCNQQGVYYGCNNPPYTTPESCGQVGIDHYQEEGYTDVSLNCCTQASWGWNCYLNGQAPTCNEQGSYYGCNNPPYTTPESCGQIGVDYYQGESYTDVSLNCCTQASWGWNCYINGEQPAPIQEEAQQELYYGCNNPPYTTAESCGTVGIQHYTEEGNTGVSLDYCTQASWGWNCYFNEQTEQQPTQQSTTCNEQGLYYGCNNPPYTTPESCGQVGTQHYTNEGYTGVNLNCCTQAAWGWNCYLNGQQAPAGSYVTTCVCTGDNCIPLEN